MSVPLSATKRWRLVQVLDRAGEHGTAADMVTEEPEVSEAIHAAAHPGRTSHEATDEVTEAPESEPAGEDA